MHLVWWFIDNTHYSQKVDTIEEAINLLAKVANKREAGMYRVDGHADRDPSSSALIEELRRADAKVTCEANWLIGVLDQEGDLRTPGSSPAR